MQGVFTDRAMLQSWLDAEAALSGAQADLGIIPQEAADRIAAVAKAEDYDLDALADEVKRTAHPVVPLIRVLTEKAGPDAGPFVHLGATTQDITDTGLVLQARAAVDILEELLKAQVTTLTGLAREHRDQPMIGRTHAQHALPITLGFKFAVLAAECDRHLERLADLRPRVLVGELGGAVGSMASFGDRGLEVSAAMMGKLGLGNPVIPWHSSRDGLTEVVSVMAMIAATCGKIANEVRVLQRTEVGELEEPFSLGKVGSSTMPHKRNPMYAEFIVTNAILARQAPAAMLAAMHQEHERDMTLWGVEWSIVGDTACLTAGLLEHVTWILDGLIVHPEALAKNLHLLGDLMLSEAAMMHLATFMGKDAAHEVVYSASMKAWDTGKTLQETLLADPEVVRTGVSAEVLTELLVPETYLGACQELVDRVVTHVETTAAARVGVAEGQQV
jgi:adenylosuccinate lyase